MYAGRKRRKPAQKGVKPAPADGAKSNPSKRHRDRLNSELDRLAGLLPFPEDVVSSLDKLSILRLSVSFLRTKSFFSVALKKQQPSNGVSKSGELGDDGRPAACVDGGGVGVGGVVPEGELLLQALNGFVLVVTAEGIIFYCSHTIQDYLGFHQTDVMHQSVFELIHTEDQQEFRSNLHWALNPPAGHAPDTPPANPAADGEPASTSSCLPVSYDPDQLPPENSSFLERGFVCRFRCLLDNSSGFLALNIQGRLKFLHGQRPTNGGVGGGGGVPPQLALFAIATPLQPPAILEIRTRNMIFRTKHKLDFTPMACDAKGKIVLGYTEAELRVRGSGYQFIHAADMLYCAENHVRMIKTGESGLTVFRLLTKDNRWKWVQANARLVYKNGKPDYIIATQRPLVDEEGGEHLRKRSMHLPFTFATGEAMLYQTGYPLHGFPDSSQPKAKGGKPKRGKADKSSAHDLDPKSLLGALMSQDESVYVCRPDTQPPAVAYHAGLFSEPHADDGWRDGETGHFDCGKTSSFDPLLATLDSLSLDGEESCSNSELFSALENLGLNAEDLELLLLDERMMQVELHPAHVPTLGDLLTNNEILSYIHDSLESAAGDRSGLGSSSDSSQSAAPPPAAAPPIVALSQQMQQQHVGAGEPPKARVQTPNGHWATENHPRPRPGLKASPLNGEQKHLRSPEECSTPWQLQQDQHAIPPQVLPPGFQHQVGLNGSHVPNGLAAFPVGHSGFSIPDSYLGPPAPAPSYQLQAQHKQLQAQAAPAPYPPQGPALELEQLLGLSQPPLDAYGVFGSSQDGKLENGCLLSAANAAYIRTCLLPNGNGVAAPVADLPDGLASLQDPHKSGFFL